VATLSFHWGLNNKTSARYITSVIGKKVFAYCSIDRYRKP
jgi:hypothetical protein